MCMYMCFIYIYMCVCVCVCVWLSVCGWGCVCACVCLCMYRNIYKPVVYRFRPAFSSISSVHKVIVDEFQLGVQHTCASVWRGPLENDAYEFVLALLAVSCLSCPLIGIVLVMCGRGPYCGSFGGCSFQVFFFKYSSLHPCALPLSVFCIRLISAQVVHPFNSYGYACCLEKMRSILSDKSDFHITEILSIAIHTFTSSSVISFSIYYHCFRGM